VAPATSFTAMIRTLPRPSLIKSLAFGFGDSTVFEERLAVSIRSTP
jgi:hypothetical protein